MSADLLRRAAAKIRETAQAANTDEARTPYGDRSLAPVAPEQWGDMVDGYLGGPIGAHAALWSPDVAVLVADLLDSRAGAIERDGFRALSLVPDDDDNTANYLARLILKEES